MTRAVASRSRGWFGSISEVPQSALSMSVRQILKSREIICVVPDERKAVPVKAASRARSPRTFPRRHCATMGT